MDKKNLMPASSIILVLTASAIVLLTAFAYEEVRTHQFLNFDDNVYVAENEHVRKGLSLRGVGWAFAFNGVSYWHPATWLSHMLDCQIFGVEPGAHLLVNLALHILNALLLFFILCRMTSSPGKAALAALFFALHPLNVESVAWISERKTVLSAFFFMSAIYAYLHYVEKKKAWLYVLVLCLYAAGLLSKPVIIVFPALLLILDYWPLRRFGGRAFHHDIATISFRERTALFFTAFKADVRPLILEKAPFIVLSLISVTLSLLSVTRFQDAIGFQAVPFNLRVYNLFVSVVQYLRHIAWPVDLSVFYPFPIAVPLYFFLPALAAVFFVAAAAFKMRENHPWLLAGWLWFLTALLPAGGLIQSGLWPAMANRFMYLPMIGIFIMAVWEGDARIKGRYSRALKAILSVALLVYFLSLARVQNIYFSNSYALFKRCLEVAGDNFVAHNNVGDALASLNRVDEAAQSFARAMALNPGYALPFYNYGLCLAERGNHREAIIYFRRAIALNPGYVKAHINLGVSHYRMGNTEEARKHLLKAVALDPDNARAHQKLSLIGITK